MKQRLSSSSPLLALFALLLAVIPVAAQEEMDDALADLLAADEAEPIDESAASLILDQEEQISGSPWEVAYKRAKYKFELTGYTFLEGQSGRVVDGHTDMGVYSRFAIDTSVPLFPDTRLVLAPRFAFGSEGDMYHVENPFDLWRQSQIRPIDFRELYVTQGISDDWEFTAGRKTIDIGVNTLYSPNNRISPIDAHFPDDSEYIGVYQIGLAYYSENSTTEFVYLPFFQDNKEPHPNSRWVTGRGGSASSSTSSITSYSLAGSPTGSLSLTEDSMTDDPGLPGFLLTEKLVLDDWDLYANFYYGNFEIPVIRQTSPTAGEIVHPRGARPSFGYTTSTGKVTWTGEVMFSIPENGKDDIYTNFALGAQYDLNHLLQIEHIDAMNWIVEYAYDVTLYEQDNGSYPFRTIESRPGRNSVFNYITLDIDDKRRLYYATTINIFDLNTGHRAGYQFKAAEGIDLEIYYEAYTGNSRSLFGTWNQNDYLATQLTFYY